MYFNGSFNIYSRINNGIHIWLYRSVYKFYKFMKKNTLKEIQRLIKKVKSGKDKYYPQDLKAKLYNCIKISPVN